MHVFIHNYDGSQTASSQATNRFQGKHSVGSGFTFSDAEFLLQSFRKCFPATDVAGCSQAYANGMLAPGGHGEKRVKRNDAVHTA